MSDRAMVTVDANALKQVLEALIGPAHLIREIQMTRSIAALTGDDPIGLLLEDYNVDAKRQAEAGGKPGSVANDLTDDQILYFARHAADRIPASQYEARVIHAVRMALAHVGSNEGSQ